MRPSWIGIDVTTCLKYKGASDITKWSQIENKL